MVSTNESTITIVGRKQSNIFTYEYTSGNDLKLHTSDDIPISAILEKIGEAYKRMENGDGFQIAFKLKYGSFKKRKQ